jgi:glycosyltransferase involved in cell wall biosynthesis
MQTVFNQSYPSIELLVIQDGGDGLASLVEQLSQKACHVQVRFLSQAPLGRSFAGNLGLQHARGQLLMFLDDDDLLLGDHIETLATPLWQDPRLSACYARAIEVFTAYPTGFESYQELAHRIYSGQPPVWDYDVLLQRNFIPIQSILFRRSLCEELGGFDTSLDQLEDWNLWLRYGHERLFMFMPKITSLFRTPANWRIRSKRHSQFFVARALAKKLALQQNMIKVPT